MWAMLHFPRIYEPRSRSPSTSQLCTGTLLYAEEIRVTVGLAQSPLCVPMSRMPQHLIDLEIFSEYKTNGRVYNRVISEYCHARCDSRNLSWKGSYKVSSCTVGNIAGCGLRDHLVRLA